MSTNHELEDAHAELKRLRRMYHAQLGKVQNMEWAKLWAEYRERGKWFRLPPGPLEPDLEKTQELDCGGYQPRRLIDDPAPPPKHP